MPYKHETQKIRLTKAEDRRYKLTDEQRDEIRRLWDNGQSQRSLALAYGVSRRLIGLIVGAQVKEKQPYQGTHPKHAEYIRKWRKSKRERLLLRE